MKVRRSGQSLTELAVLLTAVVAAIVGMQIYVRRGLQARYKGGMDHFFSKVEKSAGKIYHQYEPYYLEKRWQGVASSSETVKGYPSSGEASATTQAGWYSTGSTEKAD